MSDKPDKDQKTEKPTPQRKKQARKDGQIAKSPEVASWVIIVAATYLLPVTASSVKQSMDEVVRRLPAIAVTPDPKAASDALGAGLSGALVGVLPLIGFCAVVGLVTNLAQVGFVFSTKSLAPKAERLNPFAGLKKQFSAKSLWETAKAAAKFGVIAAAAIPAVKDLANELVGKRYETTAVLAYVATEVLSLVRLVAFIALLIAFADYLYQRRTISKQLMMTKEEMKQELKNSEGDPHVKGKIRALQRAASRNRMLAAIPDANVAILNPTHYAVVLRYRPHEGAPKVVAKGRDHVAGRIREIAAGAGVPLVESPALARALFKACEIDQEIPFRLFNGVAQVLAFVHRLNGRTSLTGTWVLDDVVVPEEDEPRHRRAS
jgi:flagellar biosynthesis protein FlhB